MEEERERISVALQRVVMQNDIANLKKEVDNIKVTLYNDGKGIAYDVRYLKRHHESGHGRTTSVINVLSVIISFVVMILLIIEKMK